MVPFCRDLLRSLLDFAPKHCPLQLQPPPSQQRSNLLVETTVHAFLNWLAHQSLLLLCFQHPHRHHQELRPMPPTLVGDNLQQWFEGMGRRSDVWNNVAKDVAKCYLLQLRQLHLLLLQLLGLTHNLMRQMWQMLLWLEVVTGNDRRDVRGSMAHDRPETKNEKH